MARVAAVVQVRSLAKELPYATGAALKKGKKKKTTQTMINTLKALMDKQYARADRQEFLLRCSVLPLWQQGFNPRPGAVG